MAEFFDRNAFHKQVSELQAQLEYRRTRYVRRFYTSMYSVVALGLIIACLPAGLPKPAIDTAPVYGYQPPVDSDAVMAINWEWMVSWLPHIFLLLLALGALLYALFLPSFYRGRNEVVGLNPQHFSLKDAIFSPLLRFFGTWEYAPDAGIMQRQILRSSILPSYDDFRAEDLVQGKAHDSLIFIAETALIKHVNRKAHDAFRGLIAVIDISEMGIRLRAPFSGHTVLLADPNKHAPQAARFAYYQRYAMPNAALEARFEAYTTNAEEAAAILTQDMLEQLLTLHQTVLQAKQQITHRDSRIGFGLRRGPLHFFRSLFMKSHFEQAYEAKHGADMDLTKANPLHPSADFYQRDLQLECREDKLILTLPCPHNFFEPNSMFEHALEAEDVDLLFDVISSLHLLAARVDKALAPTPLS